MATPLTSTRPSSSRLSGRRLRSEAGFTLLELAVVVFIISAVAALAVPAIKKVNREARSTAVANDLRVFASALQTYTQEKGDWPGGGGEPGVIPPGMDSYLRATNWKSPTPIGGLYTWAPNATQAGERYRAAIMISTLGNATVSSDALQLTDLDRKIDDGNLETGNLRLGYRNYPVYVLEH